MAPLLALFDTEEFANGGRSLEPFAFIPWLVGPPAFIRGNFTW